MNKQRCFYTETDERNSEKYDGWLLVPGKGGKGKHFGRVQRICESDLRDQNDMVLV